MVARVYGIQIVPKILLGAVIGVIKQLPFFLPALALGIILIVLGSYRSSRPLVIAGAIINFLAIWVINWPEVEWYAPLAKIVRRSK